jgi:predicted PurR-regulated permease PerM
MHEHRLQISYILLLLAVVGILNFLIFLPYFPVLFLAVVFAVVLKPLAHRVLKLVRNRTAASLLTVAVVFLGIIMPLVLFGFMIFREASQFYLALSGGDLSSTTLQDNISTLESYIQNIIPGVEADLGQYLEQGLTFLVSHLNTLFSGVLKMIFTFFLLLLGLFYLFRDGRGVRQSFVRLSPLPDDQDELLLNRLELAVNSVVRGFLVVAIVQGILTGIGFAIFGVPAPVLWGMVASVAALVPSVGTALVIVPAILYLFFQGNLFAAAGLLIWGVAAVGLIDNILGPILIRRGLPIHPFIILLSVLGGIALFGPIGFLAGPVTVSILVALVEIAPKVINPRGH